MSSNRTTLCFPTSDLLPSYGTSLVEYVSPINFPPVECVEFSDVMPVFPMDPIARPPLPPLYPCPECPPRHSLPDSDQQFPFFFSALAVEVCPKSLKKRVFPHLPSDPFLLFGSFIDAILFRTFVRLLDDFSRPVYRPTCDAIAGAQWFLPPISHNCPY